MNILVTNRRGSLVSAILLAGLFTIQHRDVITANPVLSGSDYEEILKLSSDDLQAGDFFGIAVAISGDTVVIGAQSEAGGPGDPMEMAGAAYVFERNFGGPDNWGQIAKLTPSDLQPFDTFGNSVAISGGVIVIGAVAEDGGPGDPLTNAGAAYVFERDQGGADNWGQVAKLASADLQSTDNFGYSVAVDGSTILVGTPGEMGGPGDPLFPFAGAVYVFEQSSESEFQWVQTKKLMASDAQMEDWFGEAVDISFDTIIVGARQEDGGPGDPTSNAGAAYIYERDLGGIENWGESARLDAGVVEPSTLFGNSVAIKNDRIVVGASGSGEFADQAGSAYVFERDQGGAGNWGQSAKLTPDDGQESDFFGNEVDFHGDTVLVGAVAEDGGPGDPSPTAGAVYVYERDLGGAGNWGQAAKLTAEETSSLDRFGGAIGIDQTTFVIGARGEDGGPGSPLFDSAGAAYIFYAVDGPTPTPTPSATPTQTVTGTTTASATPTATFTSTVTATGTVLTSTPTPTPTGTPSPEDKIYLPLVVNDN